MIKPFSMYPEIVGVQGCYLTKQKKLISLYEQYEIENSYLKMKKRHFIDTIGTYSAGYRKGIFNQYGGFDTNYKSAAGEDFDLSYKIANDGYKMTINDKAKCYHNHPEDLLTYFKTKYKRGFWRILLYKRSKNKIANDSYSSSILKIQFLLVFLIVCTMMLSVNNNVYINYTIFALISYVLLCIPAIKNVVKKNITVALVIPIITFVRALFFGLGMIMGCISLLTGRIK